MHRYTLIVFILLASSCGTTPVQMPPTSLVLGIPLDPDLRAARRSQLEPAFDRVAREAEQLVASGTFPGLAVGVVLDGELLELG